MQAFRLISLYDENSGNMHKCMIISSLFPQNERDRQRKVSRIFIILYVAEKRLLVYSV